MKISMIITELNGIFPLAFLEDYLYIGYWFYKKKWIKSMYRSYWILG